MSLRLLFVCSLIVLGGGLLILRDVLDPLEPPPNESPQVDDLTAKAVAELDRPPSAPPAAPKQRPAAPGAGAASTYQASPDPTGPATPGETGSRYRSADIQTPAAAAGQPSLPVSHAHPAASSDASAEGVGDASGDAAAFRRLMQFATQQLESPEGPEASADSSGDDLGTPSPGRSLVPPRLQPPADSSGSGAPTAREPAAPNAGGGAEPSGDGTGVVGPQGYAPAPSSSSGSHVPPWESSAGDRQSTSGLPIKIAFAGGAAQLQAPLNWRVYEASFGREVRLLLTPLELQNPAALKSGVFEGVWVVCHARRSGTAISSEQLREMILERLKLAAPEAQTQPPSPIALNGAVGFRLPFVGQGAHGFHLLLQAPWGVCEVHASANSQSDEASIEVVSEVANSVRLVAVAPPTAEVAAEVRDAKGLLGSWKAYRSRLRLKSNGTIEIQPDRSPLVAVGRPPAKPPKMLNGRFKARGDLLMVRWDDGSLLNFRWRLEGDRLLLTDHEGRISRLVPLLE